ncbi:MAG: ABC transporter substrate-binding protein [Alphaproteobacteria bacterium]|nr:ABC transporter substrate-binding protein [Alphaproteobacteria bacterium]
MYRIGYLRSGDPGTATTKAFLQELRKLGYEEGSNITIDYRFAESREKLLPGMAAELVSKNPDVIVVCCGPAIDVVRKATNTIPIVVAIAGDWVGQGLAKSLRRPGGNITGLSPVYPGLYGKMLQLFKETVPDMSRVAVLLLERRRHYQLLKETEEAAKTLDLTLVPVAVDGAEDFPIAFRRIESERVDGLFVLRGGLLHRNKKLTTNFANKTGLPTMYGHRQEAEAGGLMAYGTDVVTLFRGAAHYVDKIFKGANPAELPVEGPTEIDFVVNLKTARALGITVPKSILIRATKVIE